MKANELMIGDRVSYNGVYTQVAPADFSHLDWIQDVQPIPLTTEILERDGCIGYRGSLFSLPNPYFALCKDDDTFFIGQAWRGGFNEFIEIKYVHELQHVLRLCGMDELADDFKI